MDYEFGGAKRVKVVWEAISEEDIASFHKFTVSGHLEGLDIKASAQVCVQGICAIEPEKVWTLVKKSHIYQIESRSYQMADEIRPR